MAELALDELADTWRSKYPIVIDSWRNNWEKLTTYFQYSAPIRKLIYTTNAVEGYHRQIRKVTKTKGAFTSDMALLKLIYLATKNIEEKWTAPLHNWAMTVQQDRKSTRLNSSHVAISYAVFCLKKKTK